MLLVPKFKSINMHWCLDMGKTKFEYEKVENILASSK